MVSLGSFLLATPQSGVLVSLSILLPQCSLSQCLSSPLRWSFAHGRLLLGHYFFLVFGFTVSPLSHDPDLLSSSLWVWLRFLLLAINSVSLGAPYRLGYCFGARGLTINSITKWCPVLPKVMCYYYNNYLDCGFSGQLYNCFFWPSSIVDFILSFLLDLVSVIASFIVMFIYLP